MGGDTSELLRGTLATLVLSVLRRGPLYGYEIAKEIRERTDSVLRLKEGSLYPALHAMEREGLLSAEWQTVERGPSRKYYRLTDRGKVVLTQRRSRWKQFRDAVDAVLGTSPAEVRT